MECPDWHVPWLFKKIEDCCSLGHFVGARVSAAHMHGILSCLHVCLCCAVKPQSSTQAWHCQLSSSGFETESQAALARSAPDRARELNKCHLRANSQKSPPRGGTGQVAKSKQQAAVVGHLHGHPVRGTRNLSHLISCWSNTTQKGAQNAPLGELGSDLQCSKRSNEKIFFAFCSASRRFSQARKRAPASCYARAAYACAELHSRASSSFLKYVLYMYMCSLSKATE